MDRIIPTTIFFSMLKATVCFNIDPVAWKSLSNGAAGFGYQLVQSQKELLVSAPLAQYNSKRRGQIFQCSTSACRELSVSLPDFAVNASLGLTMTTDPNSGKTLACGPTIPKDCISLTMYNGVCLQLGQNKPVPPSLENCQTQADIAFLLDGSGSVRAQDFQQMKEFVIRLISSFNGKDTKFAIVQFSSITKSHFSFTNFDKSNFKNDINNIQQLNGGTNTASAIQFVVDDVFGAKYVSRKNVKKVLIVITDGESQDGRNLPNAIMAAENKKIVRFAIGVGRAFDKLNAKKELTTIASSPPDNHLFQVQNFNALEKIRESLQEKIFSIEGSQMSGQLLEMEMSQTGFSAAYDSDGFLMATVGANQWKGGFLKYQTNNNNIMNIFQPADINPDSYLGYSMAVARTPSGSLTILGAPRYRHIGAVIAVQTPSTYKKIIPYPKQSGQYFGAAVCTIDVDDDTYTDLILISAPMYVDNDREGRVYVCTLSGLDVNFKPIDVLRGSASNGGRFGSSLAVLPDLNADGFNDLAVGAPLENNGQGSIYIFHGKDKGRISLTYSQRIVASEVSPGLKFFGMSISQSSFDLSNDGLPDLAVGSKGTVVLLRSKPIVMVKAMVSFSPSLIPTQNSNCSLTLENTAKICFTMTSTFVSAQARIKYTFVLDSSRDEFTSRAFIEDKRRIGTGTTVLNLQDQKCVDMKFFVEACPEDAFNELVNQLTFSFEGLPSNTNLSPSLALQEQTSNHLLPFEINCGLDNKCVDNLNLDFNFTRSLEVKVGIDDLLNVTVSVENLEENSYNSHVLLTYPAGLSYRKVTILQGRIVCSSFDSVDELQRGKTDCTIDKPIFKGKSKVSFIVSYGVDPNSQLKERIFITANATSQNEEHSRLSNLYSKKWIDVKYSIFVTLESSQSYSNFTFGNDELQKPVQQTLMVTNDIRALNFTTVIRVPVRLGNKDIWADSNNLQIPDCHRDNDEEPALTDFVTEIQKTKRVDCTVAKCGVFKCSKFMQGTEIKMYNISANLSSGWIRQIGLNSAKFLLTSTASLEYDSKRYIIFSPGLNGNTPIRKIEAEVEVYPLPDFTREIIGGSMGGLALLVLITAVLYKVGFFKSKYKKMIDDTAGEEANLETGNTPSPEQM